MFPEVLIGAAAFVFAVIYFVHELRWVNSQLRGRPWGDNEEEGDET